MTLAAKRGHLIAVELDRRSINASRSLLDEERTSAIRDLIAENSFRPRGHSLGAYRLQLGIRENALVLDIADVIGTPVARHILSLRPLARVARDYFLICDSFRTAVRSADMRRIEAVDMARRGLHNEGAELLRERLKGKVEVDFETARRLFTLVCALNWRVPVDARD